MKLYRTLYRVPFLLTLITFSSTSAFSAGGGHVGGADLFCGTQLADLASLKVSKIGKSDGLFFFEQIVNTAGAPNAIEGGGLGLESEGPLTPYQKKIAALIAEFAATGQDADGGELAQALTELKFEWSREDWVSNLDTGYRSPLKHFLVCGRKKQLAVQDMNSGVVTVSKKPRHGASPLPNDLYSALFMVHEGFVRINLRKTADLKTAETLARDSTAKISTRMEFIPFLVKRLSEAYSSKHYHLMAFEIGVKNAGDILHWDSYWKIQSRSALQYRWSTEIVREIRSVARAAGLPCNESFSAEEIATRHSAALVSLNHVAFWRDWVPSIILEICSAEKQDIPVIDYDRRH